MNRSLLRLHGLVSALGKSIVGELLSGDYGDKLNVYENLADFQYNHATLYCQPTFTGAETIANARHVLWKHMEKVVNAVVAEHVLYANTDCIISDIPLDGYLLIYDEMGEIKKDVGRGEIIGLGTYWIDVEKEDGTKEIGLKMAGVSLTVRRTDE